MPTSCKTKITVTHLVSEEAQDPNPGRLVLVHCLSGVEALYHNYSTV